MERKETATALINHQLDVLSRHWKEVCDLAGLSEAERKYFWGRQFCNPDTRNWGQAWCCWYYWGVKYIEDATLIIP